MQSNPKIATFCLNIVKQYIAEHVKWNEFEIYHNVCYSALISNEFPKTRKGDNGDMVSVVSLKNCFFFYMKIVFDYPKTSKLQSLSIHFYDQKELMLRIDWSYKDYVSHHHAQPHWHMSSKKSVVEDNASQVQTFSEFTTTYSNYKEDNNSEPSLDINRLHLYMTYNNSDHQSLDLSDQKTLTQWLKYTMEYMDEELRALKKHNIG